MINTIVLQPRVVLPSNDPLFEENQYAVFNDTRIMVENLRTYADEVNQFGVSLGLAIQATSASSNTISKGNKTFSVANNLGFATGMNVTVASDANVANRMSGAVISYNNLTGALVIAIEQIKGSGTFSDWTISLGIGGNSEANLMYGMTTGTGTAYETNFTEPLAEYSDTQTFKIKFHAACETNATLRIGGVNPPLDLKIQDASGQYINVFKGDITANHVTLAQVINNGTALLIQSAIEYKRETRNAIMNGKFAINQRSVTGTVTLAANVYGHDGWKAGAAGCTYTFSTINNVTTVNISAGSLIQVVEGLNLESNNYTLSWQGTAQGKIGTGAFSASGITSLIVGGTNTNIEFNVGTLTKAQFEEGLIANKFHYGGVPIELSRCQHYARKVRASISFNAASAGSFASTPIAYSMRAAPIITNLGNVTNVNAASTLYENISADGARFSATSAAAGTCTIVQDLLLSAEL